MAEKILFTGGSGFIGSEAVDIAHAKGMEILNLDIRAPRVAEHLAFWREIDVRDHDAVVKTVVDFAPDRLVHLASDIDVSIVNFEEFKTTINGTKNIISAVSKLPNLKRFVHTSTQFVVMPGVQPHDERHLEPYTVYGQAKAETERLVWAAELEVPWFIVRPTIIWGPNHPSFAEQIFKHIASGRYLHPVGRMPITRAFGYVENTAQQLMDLAVLDGDAGAGKKVFYLGDESLDYDDWADAFAIGLTGRPARRIPVGILHALGWIGDRVKSLGIPSPIDSGRAFRMSTASRIDLSPTHQVVGQPKIGFERGVKETLQWLERRKR